MVLLRVALRNRAEIGHAHRKKRGAGRVGRNAECCVYVLVHGTREATAGWCCLFGDGGGAGTIYIEEAFFWVGPRHDTTSVLPQLAVGNQLVDEVFCWRL